MASFRGWHAIALVFLASTSRVLADVRTECDLLYVVVSPKRAELQKRFPKLDLQGVRTADVVLEETPAGIRIGKKLVKRISGGGQNSGIFVEEGSSEVIKVVPSNAELRATRDLSGQTDEIGILGSRLSGARSGAKAGGPKVLGYGWISLPGGSVQPYIRYEFAGNPKQKNYSSKDRADPEYRALLAKPDLKIVEKMAELVVDAIEAKVDPVDPEFLVGADGTVRWIDCDLWKDKGTPFRTRATMSQTLADLQRTDPSLAERYKKAFNARIDASTLEGLEKDRIKYQEATPP